MKTILRFYKISVLALFLLYFSSCKKSDKLAEPPQTIELNSHANKKADFKIKSNKVTKTEKGYKFNGELLTQSSKGEAFGLGTGDFEVDTASDGSVAAISGIGMAEFPDVGVFAEMLKTFTWEKIKAHIEYQPGQYYLDTYHTELPLDPDVWYLHFKPFDETQGNFFELKQNLNSLVYHFADFYMDPLDPSILMNADISMPEDPIFSNPPGFAGIFLSHVTNALNNNNPIAFKAMMGLSNQGLFTSKAYDFPVINKDFFKSKYGMTSFEKSPSNYFVKMDEPGIPIPYTADLLTIAGEEYLHQPAILTHMVDFSQGSLLDYLNNTYQGGYMMDFNGKLKFGGNKYFSEILNGLGTINDIVGKDVFNSDLNLDLAQATLQIQIPGTIAGADDVPSYFRFGGLTEAPLASDIFGEGIRKYIPSFTPPAPQQFIYVSAGPTQDDYSIYLEEGARVLVPLYGDLDLGSAYFYISLKGIEMGSSSNIDVGPFHIDEDIKGTLSTKGFSLNMETSQDFTIMNDIKLGSSKLKINASSDSGITFHGDVHLPFGLGMADVKGKFTNGNTSFSGVLKAGSELTLSNGTKLPTANMKFSLDESKGIFLDGKVNIPYVGWASVKGKITGDDFALEGQIATGGVSFGGVSLPYSSAFINITKKDGVYLDASFQMLPFGYAHLGGHITSSEIELNGLFFSNLSLGIGGHDFSFASGKVAASNAGVTINGNIDLYFAKIGVKGSYFGPKNFTLTGNINNYKVGNLQISIDAAVTANNISMTGTGTVYTPIVHTELFSGAFKIVPDWANKTVRACYSIGPQQFCITL